AGTVLLKADFFASDFRAFNGFVFLATSSNGLWKTDGTAAGTVLVKSIWSLSELTPVGDKLFFAGDDGTTGSELWVSDGTTAGTKLVKDINLGTHQECLDGGKHKSCTTVPNSSGPSSLANLNGDLLFAADDGKNGQELWRSDGTANGTTLVKNINKGSASSFPESLTVRNSLLYFFAASSTSASGLWQSDGTT